ncbi:MAG TPA: tRNA glutamyl-Q(34) synthetase GluQRS [Aquabacterium sp.]|uniref:tRNA glutamyl-Q(34) synthetase GluQRS n=1 Tax=Aquabacterium sp. TaxID=1872578 RepID=UPI002E338905|nr:tRNA glutamyl-Q(34) synthetase GluQRS [Aquabacterium sp.]HEX5373437.1 tRNA glutamyl-Q(34) synthetase GluQRS [Aquabacterium sp.]
MAMRSAAYVGRFAPSPTGPLHAGSLVAALASWLDARAHQGRWLVRIEDVDLPRCIPGADQIILQQLAQCGLHPDGEVLYQHRRGARYQQALDTLIAQGRAYPCACTRADIAAAHERLGWQRQRHGELVYPGTCRPDHGGLAGRPGRAWRVAVPTPPDDHWTWHDRRLGPQQQDLASAVGDFVVRRADGLWAYQLAVVVDDADQGITDVVRGEDLADNTPRQQWLQHLLGLPTPRTLHTPLVLGVNGEKLSKQNGAQPLNTDAPLHALSEAALALGLPALQADTVSGWLSQAVQHWPWRLPSSVPQA